MSKRTDRSVSEDDFPYKRFHLPNDPATYFRRAQDYVPKIQERVIRTLDNESRLIGAGQYDSLSNRTALLRHFPLHYLEPSRQARRAVIILTPPKAYQQINVLPDYFTEEARVRDIGSGEFVSPHQYWRCNRERIKALAKTGSKGIRSGPNEWRETLWQTGPKEARQGKITNYLTLFLLLRSRAVLDPSAAWGDRLIAALASPVVETYTGVDPHSLLEPGWNEILHVLGPLSQKSGWKSRFTMVNEPFEDAGRGLLPLEARKEYDTVIISPPPLVGDQYDSENADQAAVKYPDFKEYALGFLYPYLNRAAGALQIGGHLCITVLDRPRSRYMVTELMLLMVESLENCRMHYRGAIMWQGDSLSLVPWFIFEKRDEPISRLRLSSAMTLLEPYSARFDQDPRILAMLDVFRDGWRAGYTE